MTRTNWFPYTIRHIFGNNILSHLFGMGFGSVTGFLYGTATANKYFSLGYGGIVASTIYFELGLIGLLGILLFFTSYTISAFNGMMAGQISNKIYRATAKGFAVAVLVYLFYANFLYNESCFIVFFGLALPYISFKDCISNTEKI